MVKIIMLGLMMLLFNPISTYAGSYYRVLRIKDNDVIIWPDGEPINTCSQRECIIGDPFTKKVKLYGVSKEAISVQDFRKQKLLSISECRVFIEREKALNEAWNEWIISDVYREYDNKFGRGSILNSLYHLFALITGQEGRMVYSFMNVKGFDFYPLTEDKCNYYFLDNVQNDYQKYLKQLIKDIHPIELNLPEDGYQVHEVEIHNPEIVRVVN